MGFGNDMQFSKRLKRILKRRELLNVILFFDGGKTRTFRASGIWLGLLVVALGGVLGWGVVSVGVLIRDVVEIRQLKMALKDSQEAVLSYQVRFENVYESAYPAIVDVAAKTPEAAPKKEEEVPPAPPAVVKIAKVAAKKAAAPPQDAPAAAVAEPAIKENITVTTPKITVSDSHLVVRFNIHNPDSKQKARGYIWAAATLATAEGAEPRYIGYPAAVEVDEKTGLAKSPKKGETFSVRRHRPSRLKFNLAPENIQQLKQVRVVVLSKEGEILSEQIVPVDAGKLVLNTKNKAAVTGSH